MKNLIQARAFNHEGMYVFEFLPAGVKKPKGLFVCLHGFPAWSTKNYDVAEHLCLLGYAVLVPHYHGLGFSRGKFSFQRSGKTMDDFIGFARKKYGLPISLMGHSWGGYLAITLCQHAQQLLLFAPLSRFPDGKALRQVVNGLFNDAAYDCRGYTKKSLRKELGALAGRFSLEKLKMVPNKVLVVHGKTDSVIPIGASRALAAGSEGRAELLELDDGHLLFRRRRRILEHVSKWLKANERH